MSDPVFKALLVGASTFPEDPHNLPALKGPPHDVRMLEDALTHPQVGLHQRGNVTSLLNYTRAEILDRVEGFFADAGKDDQLILYYSGHGRQDGRGNLYLAARDTRTDRLISSAISDETINAMIDGSAAGRVVLVLDCCHSGSFKGLDLPETLKGTGRFLLTSCRSRELAVDAGEGDGPSAFTKCLVEALLSGEVDSNRDGFVSLNEVYDYVLPRLKAASKQIPQRYFDRTVAEVAMGRSAFGTPVAAAAPPPPAPAADDGGRPALNVSETSIDLDDVRPGEELAPEIIDVFNEGGGALDWTAVCEDDWITVEQQRGFVKITMRPKPGVNRGKILVRDRGRGGSKTIRVKVQMAEEERKPKLVLSHTSVDFGKLALGANVPARTVRITNAGGGDLRASVTSEAAWIDVHQRGEIVDVVPRTDQAGTFEGAIVVESEGGAGRIAVSAVVEAGPVLAVEPRSVDFGRIESSRGGKAPVRHVKVSNAGGGKLEWSFDEDGTFFGTSRTKSGLSLTLGEEPGRHRGSVRITSNGGDATVDVRAEVVDDVPPIPVPSVPATIAAPDIRGRWNSGAGVVEISGAPPQFQFVEYNVLGIAVGQGVAVQQGAIVQLQGFNLLAGGYAGQLQVIGNQMTGAINLAAGTMPLTLVRG